MPWAHLTETRSVARRARYFCGAITPIFGIVRIKSKISKNNVYKLVKESNYRSVHTIPVKTSDMFSGRRRYSNYFILLLNLTVENVVTHSLYRMS